MQYLTTHATELSSLLLSVLGAFSIIAKLTPTESDNKVLDTLLTVVHALGLTK